MYISECTGCHTESLWSSGQQPQSGQDLLLSEMQELCMGICGEHLHKDPRQEQLGNITDTWPAPPREKELLTQS